MDGQTTLRPKKVLPNPLAGRPMDPAELFWAGGWSDHPSPSLHSKIFEKSKIDVTNWYLYSETLC